MSLIHALSHSLALILSTFLYCSHMSVFAIVCIVSLDQGYNITLKCKYWAIAILFCVFATSTSQNFMCIVLTTTSISIVFFITLFLFSIRYSLCVAAPLSLRLKFHTYPFLHFISNYIHTFWNCINTSHMCAAYVYILDDANWSIVFTRFNFLH